MLVNFTFGFYSLSNEHFVSIKDISLVVTNNGEGYLYLKILIDLLCVEVFSIKIKGLEENCIYSVKVFSITFLTIQVSKSVFLDFKKDGKVDLYSRV